jgi:hypothetical protein
MLALSAALAACAPTFHDFHDRILEPLAVQKADELAEQNRIQVRQAFEEATRRDPLPGERWFEFLYWGLDAMGFAGYGVPGQGRVLEKFKDYYQRASRKHREDELNEVLRRIDEEKVTNRTSILNQLADHTTQEFALFGKVYAVCLDGVARRYRATGNSFSRLHDKPC